LSEGLNHTDLAVLERYADPRALLAAGPARLNRLITTTSRGQLGQAKVQALRTAAAEAVALWEGDSAIAIEDLAAEVASEARLVRAAELEGSRHEPETAPADACCGPTRPPPPPSAPALGSSGGVQDPHRGRGPVGDTALTAPVMRRRRGLSQLLSDTSDGYEAGLTRHAW
jgi:hypothetical protein